MTSSENFTNLGPGAPYPLRCQSPIIAAAFALPALRVGDDGLARVRDGVAQVEAYQESLQSSFSLAGARGSSSGSIWGTDHKPLEIGDKFGI